MFAYYKKRRVGGRTSHLARGDRVPIHLLTYLVRPRTTKKRRVGGRTSHGLTLPGGIGYSYVYLLRVIQALAAPQSKVRHIRFFAL